jgi:hypothetical protein
MTVRIQHEKYNPSVVLSNSVNREEYDFLFSNKTEDSASTTLESLVNSVKDVGSGFVELFVGNANHDPSRVGEAHRVAAQYAAGFQSFLGLAKMLSGDVYSGFYNSLLGVLGVSCSREGKSKDMLKTYVVISFINGCVQVMEVFQASLSGVPLIGHGLPFLVNVSHYTTILNPVASFMGAYLSWQYIKAAKQQYMLALAHYHLQMLMMHQQQQMMQVAASQQRALGQADIKTLPPISEDDEHQELCEATGGSENPNPVMPINDGSSTTGKQQTASN